MNLLDSQIILYFASALVIFINHFILFRLQDNDIDSLEVTIAYCEKIFGF